MAIHALSDEADRYTGQHAQLLIELRELFHAIEHESDLRLASYAARYPQGFTGDARNLADYLALRSRDLRPLQEQLVAAGLSSLGRGESQVRRNLARIISMLDGASGYSTAAMDDQHGAEQLESNTEQLFGKRENERYARIMVTLPTEAALQPRLVSQLVEKGVDCVRINCAHDGPDIWQQMIHHVRSAGNTAGRHVRIFMDLGGHKIRTGKIKDGPPVMHLRVGKDAFGNVSRPARVLLGSSQPDTASGLQYLPIDEELRRQLQPGDTLRFRDAREKRRVLTIQGQSACGDWIAESNAGIWLRPGTLLHWQRPNSKGKQVTAGKYRVREFPGKPQDIRLFRGDHLLLRNDTEPGSAKTTAAGLNRPAEIGCSHPAVVGLLKPGDHVWIDDGKLGCIVEQRCATGALLRVTQAGPKGVRIRSDKGINLPDTELPLPALTGQDLSDLDFVCAHADMVGLSFVRKLADIDALNRKLAARGRPDLPVVLKIETAAAVRNLPDLLLGSMGRQPLGVMIARGDLAVELGSVRMAEIQEEILWICEAARVPVVWATQVLDSFVRKGMVSRPEITDAAMSVRAECVMMNKGDYIVDAVGVLNNILTRMDAHQYKKVSRLRKLHW